MAAKEILALIPARSGSKGIPHKNIRPLAGKPLLAWSVEQALASELVTRVVVSTDSERYARTAREWGAETPFLRPRELARDLSTDLEAFRHALEWFREHEAWEPGICLHLRPTYPTRRVEDIDRALQLLLDDPTLDSVRSVTRTDADPMKMWFLEADGVLRPVVAGAAPDAQSQPRQSSPQAYVQNAAIDAARRRTILGTHSMTGDRVAALLMDEFLDVNTEEDFLRVEATMRTRAH